MIRYLRKFSALLVILLIGLIWLSPTTRARAATSSDLQTDFNQAATKYKVPVKILMSVSYNETLWDSHDGKPSTSGGYGVMHLTDVSSTVTSGSTDSTESTPDSSALHTLNLAAKLTGYSTSTLKTNTKANIYGGAALLAYYQKELKNKLTSNINDWYGAVEKYSQFSTKSAAQFFANNVYKTIKKGVTKADTVLSSQSVSPLKDSTEDSTLATSSSTSTDGPSDLNIESVPALYEAFDTSGDYGNYDLANRPKDGLKIRYIVIHDTECTFDEALNAFSTPTYTSSNYVISSVAGTVAEMVQPQNVAWHAGNWYINSHSIGIEHEGYADVGGYWYSEAMYESSAKLVKYLAAKYDIPLDRQHIIGHDNVPGLTVANVKTMHWDPGTYWDWNHYFKLLGVDLSAKSSDSSSNIVTITPKSTTNLTSASGQTVTDSGVTLPLKGSNFVYLYKKPSFSSDLITDSDFTTNSSGSTEDDDWTDKAVYGQQFCKIGQSGDWTEINYGGKNAWFYNPDNANTTTASGKYVTTKSSKSVAVYGSAYPSSSILKKNKVTTTKPEKIYTMKAGQKYVYGGEVPSDYFNSQFDSYSSKYVIKGTDKYVQIQFNHRIAFVKASDVDILK